jgi:hypothetical protein
MSARPILLLIAACLLPLTAVAQWRLFESDFDDARKTWKEIEAKLPPYPREENLIQFERAASGHRFFVDAPSISIGEDGVVRYTLVVKAAGGATNVTFEGMRCETREQKYYAIGHADGTWSRARDPRWRRIKLQELNRHYVLLYADYLCRDRRPVRRARDAIRALKYPVGPP